MVRLLAPAGIVVLVAAAWVSVLPSAPAAQPLEFNHAKHTAMACTVCHRGAETSARAGIPAGGLCLKCHATAPAAAAASAFWDRVAGGEGIRWVRLTRVPDHVMFSHRRHVTLARLACSSCHADLGSRAAPARRAPIRLDMEACLSCHRKEGASQDCAACHR